METRTLSQSPQPHCVPFEAHATLASMAALLAQARTPYDDVRLVDSLQRAASIASAAARR